MLAAAADGRLDPVQMQKTLFILSQEAKAYVGADFYTFRPYNYGPFDSLIYRDVDQLARQGLLIDDNRNRVRCYVLTQSGAQQAQAIGAGLPTQLTDYIRAVVTWAKSVTFDELLRAVYARYPAYAVNSVFSS